MNFKNVELSDLEAIGQCVALSGCRACDFSPVNLFIWRQIYKNEICIEDGFLFRRSITRVGTPRYTFPLGWGSCGAALDKIRSDAAGFGAPLCFSGLTEDQKDEVTRHFSDLTFNFEPRRDRADYIYSTEALASLSGKKYHSKRNFINRFNQKYGSRAEISPISHEDLPEIYQYSRIWCEANGCRHDESLEKESCAIAEALNNWDKLMLSGAVLRLDGKVCAFNFASPITEDTADVHVEKADDSIEGAYAVINNALAKMLLPRFRYLNREEDMGLPGLRQAKESYRPEILLMRCDALEAK
ncbi:MAG: DUF2156 domain-containing protein [Clostridia bacterium]|nr:DUF2156 domain-containing protein [Clostridia bacterium]